MIKTVINFYFSPTNSSKHVGDIFGRKLAEIMNCEFRTMPRNLPDERLEPADFGSDDLLVCAFPVYAGRVPSPYAQAIDKIGGGGCMAIPVAVYGNRAFDDALLECADMLARQGCDVVGAIAAIAQHTFAPQIAAGRPNDRDREKLREFARQVAEKLKKGQISTPNIPGCHDYVKPAPSQQIAPLTSDVCNHCGVCAKLCPVGVIDSKDESIVTPGCILCAACVKYCPQKAKSLPQAFLDAVRQRLSAVASEPKEPELFL